MSHWLIFSFVGVENEKDPAFPYLKALWAIGLSVQLVTVELGIKDMLLENPLVLLATRFSIFLSQKYSRALFAV